MSSAA